MSSGLQVSYLYGVAVDGLSSAGHVHRLGDLQDVVWHVARRPAAVTDLPPLLPVVQNLTDEQPDRQCWFCLLVLLQLFSCVIR